MKKVYIVNFGASPPRFLPMVEMFLAYELRRLGVESELITVFPGESDTVQRYLETACGPDDMVLLWESKAAKSHHYIMRLFQFAQRLRRSTTLPMAIGGYWACVTPEVYPELFAPFNTIIHGLNIGSIAEFLRQVEADGLSARFSAEGACDWGAYPLDMSFLKEPDKYRLNDLVAGYQTSFGCPNNCYFCYNNTLRKIGADYSLRPEELVHEDLRSLEKVYGSVRVQLKDLNFFHDKHHALRTLELFGNSRLSIGGYLDVTVEDADDEIFRAVSDIGCEGLFFGLESFNSDTLKRFNKHYSKEALEKLLTLGDQYGLFLSGSVLLGLPWQTEEDIRYEVNKAMEYMNRYKYLLVGFNSIRPVMGTQLQRHYYRDVLDKLSFQTYLDVTAFKVQDLQETIYGTEFANFNLEKLHTTALGIKFLKTVEAAHATPMVLPFIRAFRKALQRHALNGCRNKVINSWLDEDRLMDMRKTLTRYCMKIKALSA